MQHHVTNNVTINVSEGSSAPGSEAGVVQKVLWLLTGGPASGGAQEGGAATSAGPPPDLRRGDSRGSVDSFCTDVVQSEKTGDIVMQQIDCFRPQHQEMVDLMQRKIESGTIRKQNNDVSSASGSPSAARCEAWALATATDLSDDDPAVREQIYQMLIEGWRLAYDSSRVCKIERLFRTSPSGGKWYGVIMIKMEARKCPTDPQHVDVEVARVKLDLQQAHGSTPVLDRFFTDSASEQKLLGYLKFQGGKTMMDSKMLNNSKAITHR